MKKLLVAVCMLSTAQTSQTMETSMKINKAVIPAAGLGTRFLPYTKSIPKEMLPILEKPSIQLIVEEGLGCGINDFIIIANDDKQALKNFLSHQPTLENELAERGKLDLLAGLNHNIDSAQFNFVPQPKALGLGHAVLQTKDAVGDEYFGIFLPDEIMVGDVPALAQLITVAQKYNASVIGVLEVPHDKVSSYGIVAIREQLEDGVFDVAELVEKPAVEKAPSNLAIVGRYILSSRIFSSLEKTKPGAGNEIQLTDGILDMMRNGERVIAYVMNTSRYDVGNPLGWLQANIDIGFKNPKIGPALKEYCAKLLATK
jgi:UTP--glucose-1-phosphate uridylyltransferase